MLSLLALRDLAKYGEYPTQHGLTCLPGQAEGPSSADTNSVRVCFVLQVGSHFVNLVASSCVRRRLQSAAEVAGSARERADGAGFGVWRGEAWSRRRQTCNM